MAGLTDRNERLFKEKMATVQQMIPRKDKMRFCNLITSLSIHAQNRPALFLNQNREPDVSKTVKTCSQGPWSKEQRSCQVFDFLVKNHKQVVRKKQLTLK